jgi:hypothetical protein
MHWIDFKDTGNRSDKGIPRGDRAPRDEELPQPHIKRTRDEPMDATRLPQRKACRLSFQRLPHGNQPKVRDWHKPAAHLSSTNISATPNATTKIAWGHLSSTKTPNTDIMIPKRRSASALGGICTYLAYMRGNTRLPTEKRLGNEKRVPVLTSHIIRLYKPIKIGVLPRPFPPSTLVVLPTLLHQRTSHLKRYFAALSRRLHNCLSISLQNNGYVRSPSLDSNQAGLTPSA